jgi:Methyltransferase domain
VFLKEKLLLSLMVTRPLEAYDRAIGAIKRRFEGEEHEKPLPSIAESCNEGAFEFSLDHFDDPALQILEQDVADLLKGVAGRGPIAQANNGDSLLSRICYAACRSYKPKIIVETGVANGVTTAFILKALEQNGFGELWSIDLPPLEPDVDQFVGSAIPAELKPRWHLIRGTSRRYLPWIIGQFSGGIDIFLHDSLHTYRNMMWEFNTVWPKLNMILIADDIEQNTAFREFVACNKPSAYSMRREQNKSSVLGIALKRAARGKLV